jgi:hypothetical protein
MAERRDGNKTLPLSTEEGKMMLIKIAGNLPARVVLCDFTSKIRKFS